MPKIPKWKLAILIWIAIYPTITILFYVLGPYLMPLPIPLRTLCFTLILVPLMVFVLIPTLMKLFSKWLN